LQRRKTRTRKRDLGAALAAALLLAGCGSGAEQDVAPQPTLQRRLAQTLAEQSDSVARALAAGDDCAAAELARQLQQQTIAAINAGRVPGPFLEPLQDRVNDLATRIRCVPAPPVEEPGKDKGHGKGKKEKKKHHKGGD
jgi:hypothetical protein